MYLASKYEDVIPINSYIAFDKISHRSITQKTILDMEKEFLFLMDFNLDFVTNYDLLTYQLELIKENCNNLTE